MRSLDLVGVLGRVQPQRAGAGVVEAGARELDAERKSPDLAVRAPCCAALRPVRVYFNWMFGVAVPPSGEVMLSDFGGVHQKPVELPPVLVGLTTPALVRMASSTQLPRASTGAVPITVPAALPVHAPFTLYVPPLAPAA